MSSTGNPDDILETAVAPVFLFILRMLYLSSWSLPLLLAVCSVCECFRGSFFADNRRCQVSSLFAKKTWGPPSTNPIIGSGETSSLPKPEEKGGFKYTVEMTKRAGISWGSDLSFRWIYVLDLEQSGEASMSGLIEKVTETA